MSTPNALVVGGTSGIGWALAQALAARGEAVVLTSRDAARAQAAADKLGPRHRGIALDLADPQSIPDRLADLPSTQHLALVGSERDRNSLAAYDIAAGVRGVTAKLVGYTTVLSVLLPRFAADASVVVLGGAARKITYPGSTSTGLTNGGVSAMVATLAVELSPVRINAVHPGPVVDTPNLAAAPPAYIEALRTRTASGRLALTEDVVGATLFLFDNRGVNSANLEVDGGFPII